VPGPTLVMISNNNDGTNTLQDGNPGNDITVGNWDPSQAPKYSTTRTPINAVQVKARRLAGSPGGAVGLFFTRILSWPFMGTSAVAIATSQPSESPITLCIQACKGPDFVNVSFSPELFYWAPYPAEVNPGSNGIAWSIFSETTQANDPDLANSFLCGNAINACGRRIYTSNSNDNSLARQFRCAFKNPDYRSADKTCSDNPGGACGPGAGRNVTSWKVLVPLLEETGCPPGAQPIPRLVVKYAKVRITEVYASGGGGTNRCACGAYDAPNMGGSTPNAIIIDQIECQPCGSTTFFTNLKSNLVN